MVGASQLLESSPRAELSFFPARFAAVWEATQPVLRLTTEGSLIKSTPMGSLNPAPEGLPIIIKTLESGTWLAATEAIVVFLLKCPSPKPSCE